MKVTISHNGTTKEIEVRRRGATIAVWLDGRLHKLTLQKESPHGFVATYRSQDRPQARLQVFAHREDNTARQLWLNGRYTAYQRVQPQAKGSAEIAGSLAAAIPSMVAEILVAVGDSVQAGDKLILLESMKMIIPIQAPIAGVVKAIHCAPGEAVAAQVPLVELE